MKIQIKKKIKHKLVNMFPYGEVYVPVIKKEDFQIRKWIIYTGTGPQTVPFVINLSKTDAIEDEIAWCIQEQIYGDLK